MALVYGADMSHWQQEGQFRTALGDDSIKFIILKASEGKSYIDNTYRKRIEEVINRGKYVGAYHFYRPDIDNEAQISNFISQLEPYSQYVRPFLDVELGDPASYISSLKDFITLFGRRYKANDLSIYLNLNTYNKIWGKLDLSHDRLWIAHYHDADVSGCLHTTNPPALTQYNCTVTDMDVWDTDVLPESKWAPIYAESLLYPNSPIISELELELIQWLRSHGVNL